MKKSWLALIVFLSTQPAFADNCVGSANLYTCTDSSGNSYSVNKIGNSTYMNGSNARTGKQWSQNSSTFGNQTYMNGRNSEGKTWNQNITNFGSGTSYSGTDSDGNSFNKFCGPLGCL